jgi:hypothetical protein
MNNNEMDRADGVLPDEVLERLRWWAESHGKTTDEATAEFFSYMKNTLGIVSAKQEEDIFLIDAAETFVIEQRISTQGNTQTMVGCFVGVNGNDKVKDKREYQRNQALGVLNSGGLSAALQTGLVARAFVQDNTWWLERKDGVKTPTDTKHAEGELPWFAFHWNDMTLALLQNNPEWARHGEPIGAHLYQRIYYFAGNTPEKIGDDIKLWRVGVTDTTTAPNTPVQIGLPCKIRVRPQPEKVNEGWEDFLNGANRFFDNVTYTDDFVDEEDREVLSPETFLTALKNYVPDLSTLTELYHTKAEHVEGYNPIGPLVVVKGRVTDINAQGWDNDWSDEKTYPIRISSFDLQRAFPDGLGRDVQCMMHAFLKDDNHGLEYLGGGPLVSTTEWRPYALKSTVLVFGRLGMRTTDDGAFPRINALGVHAIPRLAIPAGESGNNTSLEQFGDDE